MKSRKSAFFVKNLLEFLSAFYVVYFSVDHVQKLRGGGITDSIGGVCWELLLIYGVAYSCTLMQDCWKHYLKVRGLETAEISSAMQTETGEMIHETYRSDFSRLRPFRPTCVLAAIMVTMFSYSESAAYRAVGETLVGFALLSTLIVWLTWLFSVTTTAFSSWLTRREEAKKAAKEDEEQEDVKTEEPTKEKATDESDEPDEIAGVLCLNAMIPVDVPEELAVESFREAWRHAREELTKAKGEPETESQPE